MSTTERATDLEQRRDGQQPLEAPHHTDLGNARRLVSLYGHDFRYLAPDGPFLAWDGARFTSLTGQRSSTSHMYLGWGQGQTWGSSFDRVFPKLGTAPLVTITTFRWPSKKSVLTPLQIARGAGDPYLIAFNAAIARAARQIFYVRPLGEMTGWWNPWCAYTRDGRPKGAAYSTAAFRKAFARMYLILHGAPRRS